MKFRHDDLEIPEDNPFLNCKLDREKYAMILTNIAENYPGGLVLAINNKWGTGKTTFVKMWQQLLKNKGFRTIYFNAWENDFEDNPLTAFVGELQIINKKDNDKFNRIVKNAALISKNVAPAIVKAFLKKYVDSETLVEGVSDTSKSFLEIFEADIKEYSKRKESISEFKKSLSEYVANESNGKPLMFIVDELDRCRPNYAVLLLEQIKHFFSVPNIVFVLSIDKVQLENAICGVYGSEKMDSTEYLRRFIDIEYSVPDPDKEKFIYYLYQYYEFDSFFKSAERVKYSDLQYEKTNFIDTSKILINALTLRQQERIFAHARLALETFNYNNYLLPFIFVFLAYLKTINSKFYVSLSNRSLSIENVQEEFYQVVRPFITEETKRSFVQIEAYLLKLYENHRLEYNTVSELIEKRQGDNKYSLKINSKIDNDSLLMLLTSGKISYEFSDLKITYLLNKLDLLDDIKIY
nr:P-loop NTPase fold protein [uncultured Flavobacterium sp.]